MPFTKPIEQLEQIDLQRLIDDSVLEKKNLDYKRQFTGSSDSDKKELLYDLSSLANASGGYLIFGMKEENGIPVSIEGIDADVVDREKLRIEQLLQTGVEPRITGIIMHNVALDDGKAVLIVHVPKSWAAPHMVKIAGASRFYSRNSAGKYQLDVAEIRAAILLSETISEKLRNFRIDRIGKIVANEAQAQMSEHPKIVLHVIPMSAFNLLEHKNLVIPSDIGDLAPINHGGYSWNINFDGFLVHTASGADGNIATYAQLFRNKIIEAVDSRILRNEQIPCNKFEDEIIKAVGRYIKLLKKIEVDPPILVMLSLLNVKGRRMPISIYDMESGNPIDRDMLILPELLVDSYDIEADVLMKPIFDAIWNASGIEKSRGYNAEGRWVGMR